MKKISIITVAVLVLAMIASVIPASAAAAEEDLYAKANDGELIMKVEFNDKTTWEPTDSFSSNSPMEVTIDAVDPGKATFNATGDKKQNRWGGEIKGLPLTESNAYTVYFTVIRDSATASKDPNLGVFVDDIYGIYGYSNKIRFMNKTTDLAPHGYITFADKSLAVEGDTYAATGRSEQRFAMEVNGQSYTLKLYMADTTGNYILIDQTLEEEIICFATDNLGLYFYQYNTGMPVTVSDISIYKGMVLSGETLKEVTTPEETTKTDEPDTSKPDDTTADPSVNTSAAPSEDTTAAPKTDVTTAAPKTDDKKSGCGSFASVSAIFTVCAAAYVFSRKKH